MMTEGYRVRDIEEAFNIQPGRVYNWVMAGYITPSVKPVNIAGVNALFDRLDMYKIYVFHTLLCKGIKHQLAVDILNYKDKSKEITPVIEIRIDWARVRYIVDNILDINN